MPTTITASFPYRGYRVLYDAQERLWKVYKGRTFITWLSGDQARVRKWIDTHLVFKTLPR